jgi:hypothetical protein
VTLETPAGPAATATVGDLGDFTFADTGAGGSGGPVRLRLDGAGGPVRTDWFLL